VVLHDIHIFDFFFNFYYFCYVVAIGLFICLIII
jgi:hypothetical protein